MKITIIGCGYVGTAVARFWQQSGHVLTVTTTNKEKVAELSTLAERVVVMKGSEYDKILAAVEGAEMVLLSVGARTRNQEIYRATYVETGQNLVAAVKETGTVSQIIYTSSYGILGDKNGAWVDETEKVAPVNENGRVLVETEELLLRARTEKLKVCIFRLAGIYGVGRELIKIFASWSGSTRPGTGKNYINWVHLDDIVGAIELAREQQLEGIYNLSCDVPLVKREFYERLFKKHGMNPLFWDGVEEKVASSNVRLANGKIKGMGLKLIHPEIEF